MHQRAMPLLLFALLLCWMAKRWMAKRTSGWGSAFHVCVVVFVFCFVVDFPCYMTTDVNEILFQTASSHVPWSVIAHTRGKKRQAQHGVESGAPHRTEALVATGR